MANKPFKDRTADDRQPASREDARRRHRRRARRLMWRRVIVLLALFIGVWVVWRNWDTLAPDKLLARLQDFASDTAGTYPVDISGTEGRALVRSQNYTALLGDSYLTYYNNHGGEVNRYPCTYSSPLVRTAGRYVLVAEQGGRRLMLTTRSLLLADLSLEQKILSVSLNKKGQMAVLTQGAQGYAVELLVYDQKGELLYSRRRNTLAGEVALSPDGKTAALISVDAVGGALSTSVEAFSLSSTDTAALSSYTAPDTLLYRLEFLSNRCLAAVGENGALVFTIGENVPTAYTLNSATLLGYAASEDGLALVTRALGAPDGGAVTVLDHTGKECRRVDFTGEFRSISASGRRYLLLTDSRAVLCDRNGAGKEVAVAADGQQAILNGNSAVVLGLSALQEYPFT